MENSKISWTHHTFNPWRGCSKVSAGCAHCYAESFSHRNPAVLGVWGDKGTRVIASEAQWRMPLKWQKDAAQAGVRRRVFCASMADVFEDRPELLFPRARLLNLIKATPDLDWLLLTKRPENIERLWPSPSTRLDNLWLGVSVENQEQAEKRIPYLSQYFGVAAQLFLSCEPLLGPLDLLTNDLLYCIDWVIVGGESGPKARPMALEWADSLLKQCRQEQDAFFMKQLGGYPDKRDTLEDLPYGLRIREIPERQLT